MIKTYYNSFERLSVQKKAYIENHLILPMLSTQYEICINYHNHSKPFKEFNNRLKEYPYFYNNNKIKLKSVVFHRITNGNLIFMNKFLVGINVCLRKIIRLFR